MSRIIDYEFIIRELRDTYKKNIDIAAEAGVHASLITKVNLGEVIVAAKLYDGDYPIRPSIRDRNKRIVEEYLAGSSVIELRTRYNLSQSVIGKVLRSGGLSKLGGNWYSEEQMAALRGEDIE